MAGGDLLYIVAFIILPTAVLVSCIWALILLRKGALLPVRPAPPRDISHEVRTDEEADPRRLDLVEETGEHMVVDPAPTATAPIATAPVAAAPVAAEPEAGERAEPIAVPSPPSESSPAGPDVEEPPPTERTEELDVLPLGDVDVPDEPADERVVNETPTSNASESSHEGSGTTPVAPATTAAAAAAADVLMVPLDEPVGTPPSATPAVMPDLTDEASVAVPVAGDEAAADDDIDQGVSPSPTESGPRRPPRRATQLRPTEEATSRPRPRAGQRRGARRVDG